jgi:CheY-like chemotaxis protein
MSEQKKILIVDDDLDFSGAIQALLEARGYSVLVAENGYDGFEKAKTEAPDLLLLDVMMTYDNEGFELAQKLKTEALTRQLPVILITGIRKAKNLPFSFEPDDEWLPVRAVLEKPVKAEDLLELVKNTLAGC